MFMLLSCIGQFTRAWTLPNPLNLHPGSPVFGTPALASVTPGSYAGAVPGTVNFTVPNYTTLSITLRGGGGGGSSDVVSGTAAGNGGTSNFLLATASPPGSYGASMFANGGLAGVGPVPVDQGGSGGTVTVGGGGIGGLGIIGSSPGGSASYTTPTDISPPNFTVPIYTTLTVDVRGAGGGASDGIGAGQSGQFSSFDGTGFRVQANGGGGYNPASGTPNAGDGMNGTVTVGGGGAGSTGQIHAGANGGKVVRTFNAGDMAVGSLRSIVVGLHGDDGVTGGPGGGDGGGDGFRTARGTVPKIGTPKIGNAVDGSIAIAWSYTAPHAASYYNGSAGGRVTKNWLRTDVGAPPPGAIISITIGAGGAGAVSPNGPAQAGAPGRIDITWS